MAGGILGAGHGGAPALRPFGEDIWIAEGPVCDFYGFPYPTRSAVVRLTSGDLLVWSPVRLDEGLRKAVDALGVVAHLVEPNLLHHLFLAEWMQAYPKALAYAPPGLAKKRRDIAFHAPLASPGGEPWRDEVEPIVLAGSFALTEVLFFHHKSRTALIGDSIQSFPKGWFKGWKGLLAGLDGIVQPDIGAPREWRLSFVNRAAARRAVQRLLSLNPERVIVAHGDLSPTDGEAFLRRGYRWLLPT